MREEADYPTAQCFQSALEFLDLNTDADNWFLQLECFDPHEPFTTPERFRNAFKSGYDGKILDWPLYEKVTNSSEEVAEIRSNYAALVAMCDDYFGKLLDWFDEENAWENTALFLTCLCTSRRRRVRVEDERKAADSHAGAPCFALGNFLFVPVKYFP